MFEKFNLTNTIKEGIDLTDMEFTPLKTFAGMKVMVDGFYFNDKGDYGRQLVVIGNGYQINMPERCVKDFEEIQKNAKMLNAVLTGHLMLTNIKEKELSPDKETGEVRVTTTFDYKDI